MPVRLITPEILKPARYLGNELGAMHKPWQITHVHRNRLIL
jgi:hypothetical protein